MAARQSMPNGGAGGGGTRTHSRQASFEQTRQSASDISSLPQPHASTSKLGALGNPQLGSEPYFQYPTPTPEEVDEELPPGFEGENVPLGLLLDRVVRKGYGELRGLTEATLPATASRSRAPPIIAYAKTTRQSILKYLAVLRWKSQVDIPVYAALTSENSPIQSNGHAAASFPTPQGSNDSTGSPGVYVGKGKGRATEEMNGQIGDRVMIRGKVTDATRIGRFMAHQNSQHAAAVEHLKHTSKVVDGLRLRNPDLLTAMSVLSLGTYPRLPTALIDTFVPKPPLTNRVILHTLRKLNRHIRYRLKCVDYVPPDLIILDIRDGRVFVEGSQGQWRAELTIINFGLGGNDGGAQGEERGKGGAEEGRWWLTGLEWGWREKKKEKGVNDPGGAEDDEDGNRRIIGEERKAILDLANVEILPPRPISDSGPERRKVNGGVLKRAVGASEDVSMASSPATNITAEVKKVEIGLEARRLKVDAPLVRIHNFLQHLSLTYQLEVLHTQAMELATGKWRGQLSVELDRTKKLLVLRYWLRARPTHNAATTTKSTDPKRTNQRPVPDSRQPLVGGTLSISLVEDHTPWDRAESLLADIQGDGSLPSERVLRLKLGVKWEVGECGEGGGWKFGDVLNSSELVINSNELSIADILTTATGNHASHLTQHHCNPLLNIPRLRIFPTDPPTLVPSLSESVTRPLSLRVPLPSGQKSTSLLVGISSLTGLVEIEDEGAMASFEGPVQGIPVAGLVGGITGIGSLGKGMEDRGKRAKMASGSVNDGKTKLGDDIGRLITAVITENIESQMRSLGYAPTRRLPLRSQELSKADLHPASTIFLPLPTSKSHHLITKVTPLGIAFEVLQLMRVPVENGLGMKMIIGERVSVDRSRINARRNTMGDVGRGKRKRGNEDDRMEVDDFINLRVENDPNNPRVENEEQASLFVLEGKELRNMFIYSNALVAQSIIESQLKSRSIPYSLQLPPTSGPGIPKSRSAIAGLIPTFVVNSADLLKDGKAGDVAMPRVFLQIKGWWEGGRCSATTVVQLRHRPSASPSSTTEDAPPNASRAARAEGITFDQVSSVVHFESDDLGHCVGGFLEQWERLSKVIVVSGTVNKLNKIPSFKDVRMLNFDLCTAIIEYSPGYICSITYDSTTDGYVVSFDRTRAARPGGVNGVTPGSTAGQTPGIGDSGAGGGNPHEAMAGLLSWELNELVEIGEDVGVKFIGLLRATLPFLLEVRSIKGDLSADPSTSPAISTISQKPTSSLHSQTLIMSIRRYRLIWNTTSSRHGIQFDLLPNNLDWIISDVGDKSKTGGKIGEMGEIKDFKVIVGKIWDRIRSGDGDVRVKSEKVGEEVKPRLAEGNGEIVKAYKLDEGSTLMVVAQAEVVGPVVKMLMEELRRVLG